MVDFDILVIGAGSGGLAAAKQATRLGAKVAIAESHTLGGTCVNRGCVPKKLLVNAAEFVQQQQIAASLHWVNPRGLLDWPGLQAAISSHLCSIRQSQQKALQDSGVDILHGTARWLDQHTVEVDGERVGAKYIVIAVGGAPTLPDIPGKELALTSQDMFQLTHLPERLAIIGGGYIGVEFAHIFTLLGTQVTLVDTDQQVLAGFDTGLRQAAHQGLKRSGVDFIPEMTCKEIDHVDDCYHVHLGNSDQTAKTLKIDQVLLAVGRSPNLAPLNLEAAGVKIEGGKILVDEYGQTSQPYIYAIGDCVGRLPLTPVAIAEGKAVAQTILQTASTVDYQWIPSAVFGMPPIATVGWTETAAREHLGVEEVDVVAQSFIPLKQSLMNTPQKSLVKWVLNRQTDQVVGVHIAGGQAPEIIQGLIPALRQGLSRRELTSVIPIHPTSGEELFNAFNS
jgi:glutathione reductase (NADPH)